MTETAGDEQPRTQRDLVLHVDAPLARRVLDQAIVAGRKCIRAPLILLDVVDELAAERQRLTAAQRLRQAAAGRLWLSPTAQVGRVVRDSLGVVTNNRIAVAVGVMRHLTGTEPCRRGTVSEAVLKAALKDRRRRSIVAATSVAAMLLAAAQAQEQATAGSILRRLLDTIGSVLPGGSRSSASAPGFLSRYRPVRDHSSTAAQFRIEAFNLANTPHLANPNADLSRGDVGTITQTVGNPRILQFALRFTF
ncbi:MAG: hypothetical protein ABI868_04010 [Acidobacteriota bacterium]